MNWQDRSPADTCRPGPQGRRPAQGSATARAARGLVFTGPKGGRLRRSTFRRTWTRARNAVGLPDLHFHDVRHTGNTMAAGQGASLRELMERMGHSSSRAALIYQHATQERDEAIAAGMGKLLRQARRKATTADGGAGTQTPSGTQRARARKRAS